MLHSLTLREEFPALGAMPNLRNQGSFVNTAGNVGSETVKRYVDTKN
jgi:REP element-mobilizing transposase RayT